MCVGGGGGGVNLKAISIDAVDKVVYEYYVNISDIALITS